MSAKSNRLVHVVLSPAARAKLDKVIAKTVSEEVSLTSPHLDEKEGGSLEVKHFLRTQASAAEAAAEAGSKAATLFKHHRRVVMGTAKAREGDDDATATPDAPPPEEPPTPPPDPSPPTPPKITRVPSLVFPFLPNPSSHSIVPGGAAARGGGGGGGGGRPPIRPAHVPAQGSPKARPPLVLL